jgi:hypothetical protein
MQWRSEGKRKEAEEENGKMRKFSKYKILVL